MDAVTGQADSGENERLILDMVDKFLSRKCSRTSMRSNMTTSIPPRSSRK